MDSMYSLRTDVYGLHPYRRLWTPCMRSRGPVTRTWEISPWANAIKTKMTKCGEIRDNIDALAPRYLQDRDGLKLRWGVAYNYM